MNSHCSVSRSSYTNHPFHSPGALTKLSAKSLLTCSLNMATWRKKNAIKPLLLLGCVYSEHVPSLTALTRPRAPNLLQSHFSPVLAL